MNSPFGTALQVFKADVVQFRISADHLVPDMALLGLLNDLEEHAVTASQIASGPLPHRGYPNGRAAFEAAQQALLLATEVDYDRAGARAWIYFLKKDRDFSTIHPDADKVLGYSPEERFNAAVDEIADAWEDVAPGRGALISEVLPIVENQPKRPDNWAGVPIAKVLAERHDRLLGIKSSGVDALAAFNNAFSALNRGTHPGASLRPEKIDRSATGDINVTFEARDKQNDSESVLLTVAGALTLGTAALRIRIISGG